MFSLRVQKMWVFFTVRHLTKNLPQKREKKLKMVHLCTLIHENVLKH